LRGTSPLRSRYKLILLFLGRIVIFLCGCDFRRTLYRVECVRSARATKSRAYIMSFFFRVMSGQIELEKIMGGEGTCVDCFYRARVISIVLTLLGVLPSSLGGICWVPMSTALTFTSGRNRRLTISTTSTARLMALPLAFTLTSFVPPWKRVMQAST